MIRSVRERDAEALGIEPSLFLVTVYLICARLVFFSDLHGDVQCLLFDFHERL